MWNLKVANFVKKEAILQYFYSPPVKFWKKIGPRFLEDESLSTAFSSLSSEFDTEGHITRKKVTKIWISWDFSEDFCDFWDFFQDFWDFRDFIQDFFHCFLRFWRFWRFFFEIYEIFLRFLKISMWQRCFRVICRVFKSNLTIKFFFATFPSPSPSPTSKIYIR